MLATMEGNMNELSQKTVVGVTLKWTNHKCVAQYLHMYTPRSLPSQDILHFQLSHAPFWSVTPPHITLQ